MKRQALRFVVAKNSFPRLKFPEYNNFFTETLFINKIKLLDLH